MSLAHDRAELAELVRSIPRPLNTMPVPGLSLADLGELGVARVSTGAVPYLAGLHAAALAASPDSYDEVVLIAESTALPGKRDELLRAIDELITKSLAEPGVSTFRLHEDRDRPGHFMLYERFHAQQCVESHFATEHFAMISDAIADLAEAGKPTITYYARLTD